MRASHRGFDRLLNARLARHGLKSGFWYYLRALWEEDGITQKRLSDLTNVTETTTVSLISAMADAGLVIRQREPGDRRKLRVSLTAKGRALEADLMPYAIEINAIACRGIAQSELDICLSVLIRMTANLAVELESID